MTFTRKAANEMRSRVGEEVGESAKRITISTFHSLVPFHGQRPCEPGGERRRLLPFWDDKTSARELRRILREESTEKHGVSVGDLVSLLSDSKQKFFREGCEKGWEKASKLTQRCLKEYEDLKTAANALDFDDLLYLVFPWS